jgi:surface protein
MKNLNQYISEKLVLTKKLSKYTPKTKQELKELVEKLIKERGNDADLNDIDTSEITDMSELFYLKGKFNGDISKWDVSNVENMYGMFRGTTFNGDISNWDVSNVKDMNAMFNRAIEFNQDISKWDVSKVERMHSMFEKSKFNCDISNWNVSNVKYMYSMFKDSKFNQDISKWNVSKTTDTRCMFNNCPIKEEYKPKH